MNYVTNDQAYGFFSKVSEDFADVNGKIPSNASSGNKMVTASDIATKADLVDGKVPAAQLPSFVDDVLEYASTSAFPATGESGKIYVALDTNKTYRWGGSDYVEISESLALGETSSTAYAGDKGKANADAISDIQDLIPSGATTSNKLATASDIPDTSGLQTKNLSTTIGSYTTVEGALSGINDGKVDKVTGKGLSTNDYDATAKGIVDSIPLTVSQLQGSLLEKFPRSEQRVLGAKNLCESKCSTSTINGITYTKNADGSYTISGVNDGTNTSTIRIDQSSPTAADNLKSYSGRFTMSLLDANKNYVPDTAMIMMQNSTWSTLMSCSSSNSGIQTADVNASNLFMYITVQKNADFSTPKTVYPMLRLASDPDDTYAPYAMTNRELTEAVFPRKVVDAQVNANTLTDDGVYYFNGTSASDVTSQNLPSELGGGRWIIVKTLRFYSGSELTLTQFVYTNNRNYFFMRPCNNGTWQGWSKISGTAI